MGRAQSQYQIIANRRCTTHPTGTILTYTGPRSGVAKGWSIVARVVIPQSAMTGLVY